jgi:hypothetical protein
VNSRFLEARLDRLEQRLAPTGRGCHFCRNWQEGIKITDATRPDVDPFSAHGDRCPRCGRQREGLVIVITSEIYDAI